LLGTYFNHLVKKESSHTIGVEFGSKIVEVGGHMVKVKVLNIWKTSLYSTATNLGYSWSGTI
jgi:hypothetical protein